MAFLPQTQDLDNICTHLTLGECICVRGQVRASIVDEGRRRSPGRANMDRPPQRIRWGFSTDLMLYDDPWKIRKTLTMSDLGNLRRLMLHKEVVVNFVLPVLSPEARNEVVNENGTRILIWE